MHQGIMASNPLEKANFKNLINNFKSHCNIYLKKINQTAINLIRHCFFVSKLVYERLAFLNLMINYSL